MEEMKLPKNMAKTDAKDLLEKLLEDDKVNVIVVKEDSALMKVYCDGPEEDVILKLNEKGKPIEIIGCRRYNTQNGNCLAYGGSCRFIKYEKLIPFKSKS